MKKHIILIVAVFMTASLWAQSPEKMSYQAVVRNASDALVTNKAVGMKVSILKGSATGTAVYVETHKPTTNANGLVSVSIGGGTVVSGAFADIDWASGAFFLKTETDPAGGTSYSITGISQLLSVPYALHAKTAESVTGTITETDPVYAASQAKNITAAHITTLGNLSGINTGDQDLSALATITALGDSTAQVRSEIPDVSGFATKTVLSAGLAGKVDIVTGKGLSTEDYTTDEKTKLAAITGTNTGDQDISGIAANTATINNLTTKLVALLNLQILSGASVADLLAAGASVADLIGLNYQGGKIAYILQSGDPGYDANVAHGIIAAPIDQSTGIQWYNGSYTVTGATATALGTGNANTNTIVTSQGPGSYAAQLCADLVLGGYSDWYLPSKDELNKLYLSRVAVGGFEMGFYSSSTESSSTYVWLHNIVEGGQYEDLKDFPDRVRCVRAF
jgi:hypothetical protein